MKVLFILTLCLVSNLTLANCYERLTHGYTEDSSTFKVYEPSDGWVDYDDQHLSMPVAAQAVYMLVMGKLKCEEKIQLVNKTCKQIHPDFNVSQVCYLDSNLGGFFLVTKDYLENVNIIFNRYDK